MELFEQHREGVTAAEAPLAARMRPRVLAEYVGQDHILGEGRLLRRAIQADQLSSLIFYGPPGTGKTTLAMVIANTTRAHFISINAVLAGVKDIREAIATAQEKRGMYDQRTILFVDEVHRFNKAQQDALLPWVENGTVILIGATTENPYFEVNKALVSRSRVFQLKPLDNADLDAILQQTLGDRERGYGHLQVEIAPDAQEHLINIANGDARALLNALELAVETTPPNAEGVIAISLEVAEESIQHRAVLYDKEGDAHFDTISAFIKSLRGSDPDAALYWLARMVYAGEDPRFIFRRMVILAGEDVGLADPNAVVVVNACAQAFDRVGMPEGRYPLAQAALYLATCPKSNSVMGFFDALATVEREREDDVPVHLRDANRDKHSFGHGQGYLYPHAYRDHWVEQQYLPNSLQGQVFYQPSNQGYEDGIQIQVARRREAQLAALVDSDSPAEVLTFSPADPGRDRWLQRTLDQTGERLAAMRDRLFALATPQRHHVLLTLNAGSGLLTWEAVRRVPEGSVYAQIAQQQDATALQEQAALLPELSRPMLLQSPLTDLATALQQKSPTLRFDGILGRNVLAGETERGAIAHHLLQRLQPDGTLALAESLPRQGQRLYDLLPDTALKPALRKRLVKAEDTIYTPTHSQNPDSTLHWDVTDWRALFESLEIPVHLDCQVAMTHTDLYLSPALLDRWFSSGDEKPSYADYLAKSLSEKDLAAVKEAFGRSLQNQTVSWKGATVYLAVSSLNG
jgi:putative ATPase